MNEERERDELTCWEPGCDAPATLVEQRLSWSLDEEGEPVRCVTLRAECYLGHEEEVLSPAPGWGLISEQEALEAMHLIRRRALLRDRLLGRLREPAA